MSITQGGTRSEVYNDPLWPPLWQFDFGWKARKMNDGERTMLAIKLAEGKRAMYRQPRQSQTLYAEANAMKNLTITEEELEELKRIQIEHHWKWPAAFCTNRSGDIWPCETRGYTPPEQKEQIRGISKLIDAIATEYLNVRTSGGHFSISDTGASYFPQANVEIPFLTFVFSNPKQAHTGTS
jgi:hypothetical protein